MNYLDYSAALEVVKEFYAGAWGDLKGLVTIAFGVVLLIPVISGIFQLVASNKIEKMGKEIKENKERTEKLQKDVVEATGRFYFLQGNMLYEEYLKYSNGYYDDWLDCLNGEIDYYRDKSLNDSVISYFKSIQQFLSIDEDKPICTIMDTLGEISNKISNKPFLNLPAYQNLFDCIVSEMKKNKKRDKYEEDLFLLESCYKYKKEGSSKVKNKKQKQTEQGFIEAEREETAKKMEAHLRELNFDDRDIKNIMDTMGVSIYKDILANKRKGD